jgi:hypothetical protein
MARHGDAVFFKVRSIRLDNRLGYACEITLFDVGLSICAEHRCETTGVNHELNERISSSHILSFCASC